MPDSLVPLSPHQSPNELQDVGEEEEGNAGNQDVESQPSSGSHESESEEETPKGIYNMPLLVSGSRERKTVQRLIDNIPEKKKSFSIPQGFGMALGEIPNLCFHLGKMRGVELKHFHRVLFGTPGQLKSIKSNIKQFKGFDFTSEDLKERKRDSLLKLSVESLKELCKICDVPRDGKKPDLVERFLEFLQNPKILSTVSLANKAELASAKKRKKSQKKKAPKKQKPSRISQNTVSDESEPASEESSSEETHDIEYQPVSKEIKTTTAPETSSIDDNEISQAIQKYLASSDLSLVTKKNVKEHLAQIFPSLDISSKKELINTSIQEYT
eukprot:Sdes_comp23301_c0_seq1m21582